MSLLTEIRNKQAAHLASLPKETLLGQKVVLETALDTYASRAVSGDLTTEEGRDQFCADLAKQMITKPPVTPSPTADLSSLVRYPAGDGVSVCKAKIVPFAENLGHGYTGKWTAQVWAQTNADDFSECVGTVSDALPITKTMFCSLTMEGDSCHVILNRLPLAEDLVEQKAIRNTFSALTAGSESVEFEERVNLGYSVYCRPVAFNGVFARRNPAADTFLDATYLSGLLHEDLALHSDRLDVPKILTGLSLTSEGTGYFTVQTSQPLTNTELRALDRAFSNVLSGSEETTRANAWAHFAERNGIFLRNAGNALTKAIPNEKLTPVIQGGGLAYDAGSSSALMLTKADLAGLDDSDLELD